MASPRRPTGSGNRLAPLLFQQKMEYRLITAVSGFPSLYDRNSSTYRDLSKRSAAWRQVSAMVGVPEAECRRKWKILRDQHRRERRRESGGLLEPRQWRYSAVLSFLNPLVDASTAPTNSWAPQPQSSRPHDMAGCSTTSEGRSYDNYGFAVADATTTAASSSSELFWRRRAASVSADGVRLRESMTDVMSVVSDDAGEQHGGGGARQRELLELLVHSATSLAASLSSSHHQMAAGGADGEPGKDGCPRAPRPGWLLGLGGGAAGGGGGDQEDGEPKDDMTLFLLSLAPALRRLPVQKQSWIKTKIQQLVHEAEFGPIAGSSTLATPSSRS
ncbi:uncharacterized protein LOC142881182 [Nelusetta ayraudi]|uniref:uncharacterized protein LOC142881182 n=1 Tax=Nelusetta ayraudi TaxID=303726 RepID=UPI003F6F3523